MIKIQLSQKFKNGCSKMLHFSWSPLSAASDQMIIAQQVKRLKGCSKIAPLF